MSGSNVSRMRVLTCLELLQMLATVASCYCVMKKLYEPQALDAHRVSSKWAVILARSFPHSGLILFRTLSATPCSLPDCLSPFVVLRCELHFLLSWILPCTVSPWMGLWAVTMQVLIMVAEESLRVFIKHTMCWGNVHCIFASPNKPLM